MLIGCTLGRDPPSFIEGTVLDSATALPVSGADVQLSIVEDRWFDMIGPEGTVRRRRDVAVTTTDKSGHFKLDIATVLSRLRREYPGTT